MSLTIPDEILQAAGLDENEARVEIACRLFDAGKLSLPAAAKWAGLARTQFEKQLLSRRISVYRPTAEEVAADVEVLKKLEQD